MSKYKAAFAVFAGAAFLSLAACDNKTNDFPKKGEILVSKDTRTVTEVLRVRVRGNMLTSSFYAKTRIWEFGDVRQVCTKEVSSSEGLLQMNISTNRACVSFSNADPRKLDEMEAHLGS